jgi:hypothetical protein
MNAVSTAGKPIDEIHRALQTYVNLPELVDLRLHPHGIHLKTSDFPKLIVESSGLDLRQYFIDALKGADFLTAAERDKLAFDLFHIFNTVTAFASDEKGAVMHRSEKTFVSLPQAMSQGFVQQLTIERSVNFRLSAKLPDEATFTDVAGVTFNVGGKVLALRQLTLKAKKGMCIVIPLLDEHGVIPHSGDFLQRVKTAGRDVVVGLLVKARQVSVQLPVIMQEFREYLSNAVHFRELLREQNKDLVMFFERTANIKIDDPLTRSLLERGNRVVKEGEKIQLERQRDNVCDLGGVALKLASQIELQLARSVEQLQIDGLNGIGISLPFESPAELKTIGLDLHRSIPRTITSLKLSSPAADGSRRLVAGTAPGCWVGLDLAENMQPAVDIQGNWMVFGVTHNPISGILQKFFLRLDKQNNLNMTARELAEIVTQTAIDGFDPNNPFTWSWAALAIGGQTFIAADEIMRNARDGDKLKDSARKLGRFLGKLLDDL